MAKAGNRDRKGRNGKSRSLLDRILTTIEVVGNKLPDPAILFLLLLFLTSIASALLALSAAISLSPAPASPAAVQSHPAMRFPASSITGRRESLGRRAAPRHRIPRAGQMQPVGFGRPA